MGILEKARPVAFVCTRDVTRAVAFYGNVLGLPLKFQDQYAAVFATGGIDLRVSIAPDFVPGEHTVLGFDVPDVADAVRALRKRGVMFNFYKQFTQDGLGIWTVPGGAGRVAWFKDPDGNVLSVTTV